MSGGGVLSTAGNLVFQVTGPAGPNGSLYAYTADKGQKLFEVALGQGSAGPPITYMIDGKQYVAVMAGHGTGASPAFAPPPGVPLPPPPQPVPGQRNPRVYVYTLDGNAPNPTPPLAAPGGARGQ
jgi:hypothetical protein